MKRTMRGLWAALAIWGAGCGGVEPSPEVEEELPLADELTGSDDELSTQAASYVRLRRDVNVCTHSASCRQSRKIDLTCRVSRHIAVAPWNG